MEALVRRPYCGRRTRSWRQEFGDTLRGDVIPKEKEGDWNMMRLGRSNPNSDLHPGALGALSGQGRWNSVESVPENVFDGMAEDNFV